MGKLLGLYIVGSVARAENDELSDLDLLAVVRDGGGKVSEAEVRSLLPSKFDGQKPSISWYGAQRIKQMMSNGELFAWHIWAEHIVLFEDAFCLRSEGPPAAYVGAQADVASFEKILSEIPRRVTGCPENAVYELGLIYVCLRNIAMAASSELCDAPDFSRYSPFNLKNFMTLPISRADYELAMACRMSGQRGIVPPETVDQDYVADIYRRVSPWIASLRDRLKERDVVG